MDNCIGLKSSCPPPKGVHPVGPPSPPPGECTDSVGSPPTWLSPQYHLNDGGHWMQDPAGCIAINGTWFVFPDQARACDKGIESGAVFTSTDLVRWTRRATNRRFGETGGIAVSNSNVAFTFGSPSQWANVR
jgi:hypothetical protein